MPNYSWKTAANGFWSISTNWTPAGIPGQAGGDTATIAATGSAYTIRFDLAAETLNNLTIASASADLLFGANDVLTVSGATGLKAGTIDLLNTGAVLNAGQLTTSSGTKINIAAGAGITYSSATLSGLVDLRGTTSFGTSSNSITLNGTIQATSGTGSVDFSGLSGSGTLAAVGATLLVGGSLANTSTHLIISDSASSFFITTGQLFYGSSVSLSFLGAHGAFEYNNPANDTHVTFNVAGLNAGGSPITPTNFLDFASESLTIVSGGTGGGTTGSVVLSNGDTIHLSGITGDLSHGWLANSIADLAGGTEIFLSAVCYAAGTRILTPDGERRIETLNPGDIVLAEVDGSLRHCPIRWVGRRRIDLDAHPRREAVAPICIGRGAVADRVPNRDLILSPDHGVLLDGVLVCARQLVNGTTIRRLEGIGVVDYLHIELDWHAILFANGLSAESYLDTGNRSFFPNGGEPLVLHPDLASATDAGTRAARSCAPFVWEEASVLPIWQRLATRAEALGKAVRRTTTTDDPALRLLADGRCIAPVSAAGARFVFAVPPGAGKLRLVSRAAAPTDTRPWLEDSRRLGVYVERIRVHDETGTRDIPVDHPSLTRGWWAAEGQGTTLRRWTDGDASLPLGPCSGPTVLEIEAIGLFAYPAALSASAA